MSIETKNFKEEVLDNIGKSRFKSALHRIFPKLTEEQVGLVIIGNQNTQTLFGGNEKLEELTPKERVREYAAQSIRMVYTSEMIQDHIVNRHNPAFTTNIGEMPKNPYLSYSRTTKKFLKKHRLGEDNPLGEMHSPRFAFALGSDDKGYPEANVGNSEAPIYLVGMDEEGAQIQEAHQMTDEFLDGLGEEDVLFLENVTNIVKKETYRQMAREEKSFD